MGRQNFVGRGLPDVLRDADEQTAGATVIRYHISVLERYSILDVHKNGTVQRMIEKQKNLRQSTL